MSETKVFCIGFQKTGTSSLGIALDRLGYRVCGYWDFRDMAQNAGLTMGGLQSRAFQLADRYDAFKDTPWPIFYRELDQRYPGSKFIHVVRDTEKWIRSATADFADHPNMIHRLIYGCDFPAGNERVWVERYEKHNRDVKAYFSDRPDCILSLSLDRGEVNWTTVCGFLGKSVPDAPWPHANTIRDKKRRMFLGKVLQKLRIDKS